MGAVNDGFGGFLSPSCRLPAHFQPAHKYSEVSLFYRRTLVFAFFLLINSSGNLRLVCLTDCLTTPSLFSSAPPVGSFFLSAPDLLSPSRSSSFFSFSSLKPLNTSTPQDLSSVYGNAKETGKPAHYLQASFLKPSFVPAPVLPSSLWCGSCAGVSPFSLLSVHPRILAPLQLLPTLHFPSSSTFLGRTTQYGSSRFPLHGFNRRPHSPRHFSVSSSPTGPNFSSFLFPGILSLTLWPFFSTHSSQSSSLLSRDLLHSCPRSLLLFKNRRNQADTDTLAGTPHRTDCIPRREGGIEKGKESLTTQQHAADLTCISVTLSNNICVLAKAETRTDKNSATPLPSLPCLYSQDSTISRRLRRAGAKVSSRVFSGKAALALSRGLLGAPARNFETLAASHEANCVQTSAQKRTTSRSQQDEVGTQETTDELGTLGQEGQRVSDLPIRASFSSLGTDTKALPRGKTIPVLISFSPTPFIVPTTKIAEIQPAAPLDKGDDDDRVFAFSCFKPSAGAVSRHGVLPSLAVSGGSGDSAGDMNAVEHEQIYCSGGEQDQRRAEQEEMEGLSTVKEIDDGEPEHGATREIIKRECGRRQETDDLGLISSKGERDWNEEASSALHTNPRTKWGKRLIRKFFGEKGEKQVARAQEDNTRVACMEQKGVGQNVKEEGLLGQFPFSGKDTKEEEGETIREEEDNRAQYGLQQGHYYRADNLWIASQFISDTARVYRAIAGPDSADLLTLWYSEAKNRASCRSNLQDTKVACDTLAPCETSNKRKKAAPSLGGALEGRVLLQQSHRELSQDDVSRDRRDSSPLFEKALPGRYEHLTSQGGEKDTQGGRLHTNSEQYRRARIVLRDYVTAKEHIEDGQGKSLAIITLPSSRSCGRRGGDSANGDTSDTSKSPSSSRRKDNESLCQSEGSSENGAVGERKDCPSLERSNATFEDLSQKTLGVCVHQECEDFSMAQDGRVPGVPVVGVSFAPTALERVRAAAEVLTACETVTNLARFDGMKDIEEEEEEEETGRDSSYWMKIRRHRSRAFSEYAKERMLAGSYALSHTFPRDNRLSEASLAVRTAFASHVSDVLSSYECLLWFPFLRFVSSHSLNECRLACSFSGCERLNAGAFYDESRRKGDSSSSNVLSGRKENDISGRFESETTTPGNRKDRHSIASSLFSSIRCPCNGPTRLRGIYQRTASSFMSFIQSLKKNFSFAPGNRNIFSSESPEPKGSQVRRLHPVTSSSSLAEGLALKEWMHLSAELLGLPLVQLRSGTTILGQIGKDEDLLNLGEKLERAGV
ncbi:glutamyl-trna amidotransferase subunit a [Cystoisospora suis]|uniref:Glutamyl-trna amidotransferase subunit a n=1 Tax=Cystoisospora suis TaxID=483139 RepID=A0A2C6KPD0_9APIC|nr:glutamyl-trna amidotransferase subunit a [Cystoisospora suis]